ncbi:cytochrome c oxidase subunit 3 [Herbaspirillum lusitanum]|uniref:cytochrome c oxidase subunit 3 n=1 Tax=Herbaspirillum lusitanum TaxID=213312 RepID=UPI0009FFCB7C
MVLALCGRGLAGSVRRRLLAVTTTRSANKKWGFEGAAWYWHFVDVVWLGLYVVVYWL